MLNVETLTQIPASWRSHIALVIAVFSGSSAAILVRFAQHDGVPSPVIAAFRLTVGSLVLLPFIFPRYQSYLREMSRKDVFFSALAGFWLAIHLTAVNFSLEHT